MVARAATPEVVSPGAVEALTKAMKTTGTPQEVKNEALAAVMKQVGEKYKYRLPDATGRKDIEYYRDPAHRGYLAYQVKRGQSPSLYFKPPQNKQALKQSMATRKATEKKAEANRLF